LLHLDRSVIAHFVSLQIDTIEQAQAFQAHRFVRLDRFADFIDRSALLLFPAFVGGYTDAMLEALVAAPRSLLPPYVGNAEMVRALDPGKVLEPDRTRIARAIG